MEENSMSIERTANLLRNDLDCFETKRRATLASTSNMTISPLDLKAVSNTIFVSGCVMEGWKDRTRLVGCDESGSGPVNTVTS